MVTTAEQSLGTTTRAVHVGFLKSSLPNLNHGGSAAPRSLSLWFLHSRGGGCTHFPLFTMSMRTRRKSRQAGRQQQQQPPLPHSMLSRLSLSRLLTPQLARPRSNSPSQFQMTSTSNISRGSSQTSLTNHCLKTPSCRFTGSSLRRQEIWTAISVTWRSRVLRTKGRMSSSTRLYKTVNLLCLPWMFKSRRFKRKW